MKEKHEPIDFRNHRYSSIDMARETGMSSEGLRFYERKGILQVDKDEKNGYRTYPIMKVPMMRSAKILGTYGISLDSVAEIIQDHDHHLDHLDRTLEQAEARLNHDIEWKRRCLAALREQREIISHGIGTVYFAELDEMAYLEYYGAEKLLREQKAAGTGGSMAARHADRHACALLSAGAGGSGLLLPGGFHGAAGRHGLSGPARRGECARAARASVRLHNRRPAGRSRHHGKRSD